MILRDENIGGAVVLRAFNMGTERVAPGTNLTREQVVGIRNRQSLYDNGQLGIYPPNPAEPVGELMIYSRGFGKFDVIRGFKLNDEPMSKEEAEALVVTMQPGEEPSTPVEEPPVN